jgi:hypothetical protein
VCISGRGPLTQRVDPRTGAAKLRLELRDPRVAIVRHRAHPGFFAMLRDGARIARGLGTGL